MLVYGSNISVTKKPPIPISNNINNNQFPFWLRFVGQTITSIFINTIARAIDTVIPGLGIAFEAGVNIVTDLLLDYLQYGNFSWENALISISLNSLPFIKKGIKTIANKTKNRLYGISKNVINKKISEELKKASKELRKIGTTKQLRNANNRAYLQAQKHLIQNIPKDLFKQTAKESRKELKQIRQFFNKARQYLINLRQIVSVVTSPIYTAKKTFDLLTSKLKRKIVKQVNQKITSYIKQAQKFVGQKFKKIKWLFNDQFLQKIPLNSQPIESIRIIPNNNAWDFYNLSCIIFFDQVATYSGKTKRGKPPIILWNKNVDKVLGFLTTDSPFNYYLDNFAYGWEVGKFLKQNKKLLTVSKFPIVGTVLNHLIWTQKTFQAIAESLAKHEWEWKNDTFKKIRKGIYESLSKGWNFKYLNPAINLFRGTKQKNHRFIVQTAIKQSHKQLKLFKIKQALYRRRK